MLAFGIGPREQAAKMMVAIEVLAQQRQEIGLVRVFGVFQPDVRPDQGLDARGDGLAVELHRPEKVGAIGQRHGRQALRARAGDQLGDADDAVGQGIFGVDPQMHEYGIHFLI